MEVIDSSKTITGPSGIGLGNFDGLHIGHMALVNTLISESGLNNLSSIVYTFIKNPRNITRKSLVKPLISTVQKKQELLSKTGLDYLYLEVFDEEFSEMEGEDFVKEVLVGRLNMKLAVVGFNYRFGYKGHGDIGLLSRMGKESDFQVIVIPPVMVSNEVVSSNAIRAAIKKGDMSRVFNMLGRHYSIEGTVQRGLGRGTSLGFATANLHIGDFYVLPRDGVYATKTLFDGYWYDSITNVGTNPTFADIDKTSIETHIIDFSEDIYNRRIEVFFLSRIRGERKFENARMLKVQVLKDIDSIRKAPF